MRPRLPRWLAMRAEQVGLGAALAVIAALVSWWAIFAWRMIGMVRTLTVDNALLRFAGDPTAQLAQVQQAQHASQRMSLMIEGEGTFFTLLLFLSVTFLYLMARRQREARNRMERQLQVTTHALKTPIAGVRALLQTLQRGAVPPEMQQDFLAQGLFATDRLEHIAETMLACQRALAGRVRPQAIPADALVSAVLAHRAGSGVPEQASVEVGADVVVRADPDAFRVILENLLDNARKYAEGAVALRGRSAAHTWSLDVEDRGQGFAPEDSRALFEPFERGGGSSATHGSGLGLHLSRQLARDMGGDLRATSLGRGKGAVFTLELPLATDAARRREEVTFG